MKLSGQIWAVAATAVLISGTETGAQGWEVKVTPYAWMSGLSGDIGSIPGLPAGSVDLSFSEVVEDLELAGMLMASARNGPWVLYLDTTHVRTASTETLGGVLFEQVEIESQATTLALAIGRTLAEMPLGSVDAYLGARAWWLENRFDLRGVDGGRAERTETANWVDPLIGVAGRYQAADRWMLFGALEVGGFGLGAESEWSALAGATWQNTETIGASFGWRHMEVDYDTDGVVFDVTQSGPVLGATFRF